MADRVAVMYAGDIVEMGTLRRDLLRPPPSLHLGAAVLACPSWASRASDLLLHPGHAAQPVHTRSTGTPLRPAIPRRCKIDFVERPPYFEMSPTHKATHLAAGPPGAQGGAAAERSALLKAGGRCQWQWNVKTLLEVKDLDVHLRLRQRKPFQRRGRRQLSTSTRARPSAWWASPAPARPPSAAPSSASMPTSGGEILFKGQKISGKISQELDRQVIRKIQMIFQDPMASLNERAKVDYIVSEGSDVQRRLTRAQQRETEWPRPCSRRGPAARVRQPLPARVLRRPAPAHRHRPGPDHGARSSSSPTSPSPPWTCPSGPRCSTCCAELQKERGLTYLFIAHDLSVMRYISRPHRRHPQGPASWSWPRRSSSSHHPFHPYTRALLSAIPMPDPVLGKEEKAGWSTTPPCTITPPSPRSGRSFGPITSCSAMRPKLHSGFANRKLPQIF